MASVTVCVRAGRRWGSSRRARKRPRAPFYVLIRAVTCHEEDRGRLIPCGLFTGSRKKDSATRALCLLVSFIDRNDFAAVGLRGRPPVARDGYWEKTTSYDKLGFFVGILLHAGICQDVAFLIQRQFGVSKGGKCELKLL